MAILEKLPDENLDDVDGGVIVGDHRGQWDMYWIVDDKYGYVRYAYPTEAAAKKKEASKWGVSSEVISVSEYEKRFKMKLNE